jgi:MFS transporter, FHS family, glucose/mannose:H+ symporter
VIGVYMVFGALLNSVGPVILLAVQSMGVARADAALLDAFKDLPIAVVSFLVASWLPRLGLKRAMLIGLVAVALGCLLMPVLASFWAIKLMFVTIGASFALVKVSAYAVVGLVTHNEREHASFMNLLEGLFMFGVLGGYALFSRAVHEQAAGSLAWLNVYLVLAGAALASAVLLATSRIDESAARPEAAANWRDDLRAMWQLLASGLVVVFVLSAFLYVLIEQGIATWLPTFNSEVLKMPASMSVGLALLMPLATAVGRLASAVVLARLSWFVVVMACLVAIAALILLAMPLASGIDASARAEPMSWLNAPAAAYVVPLIGLFLAPIYPAVNSAMLSALPKPRHAAMTGLIVIFSALGGSFGSLITGRLFVAFDGATAFTLLLVPLVMLALALVLFKRRIGP